MLKSVDAELSNLYDKVIKVYKVKILEPNELERLGYGKYYQGWKVIREISLNIGLNGHPKDFIFYVCFYNDFPYTFPKIFIDKDSYSSISPIPHIDNNLFVCTIDTERYYPNPNAPFETFNKLFDNSVELIEHAIRSDNSEEFQLEFNAYWRLPVYNGEKLSRGLSFLKGKPKSGERIKLSKLSAPFNGFHFIIHDNTDDYIKFNDYLKKLKITLSEGHAYFISGDGFKGPPFEYKAGQIFDKISQLYPEQQTDFRHFFNKEGNVVVFYKEWENSVNFYGWKFNPKSNIKGFRNSLKPAEYLTLPIANADKVDRLRIENSTTDRIIYRSTGQQVQPKFKFCVSGLGSIGSNLIYYLNNYDVETFVLNDLPNETIAIENLKRHLLGFGDINYSKVDGIQNYLLTKNPLQIIIPKKVSLTELINNEYELINSMDYLFVCIGKQNIEQYLCESIIQGIIKTPVFLFWVEPYLAAGHVIYFTPETAPVIVELLKTPVYKYSVLHEDEYRSETSKIYLKEAGCQTGYFPYSSNAITLFLSGIYSQIDKIIKSKKEPSQILTWIGEINGLNELGLKRSNFGVSFDENYQLIINPIEHAI